MNKAGIMTKFLLFVLFYSFLKLVRIMAAGTVLMTAAFLVCQAGGSVRWRLNLTALWLVPLACLMGYSRIFYTGKLFVYTSVIQGLLTQEMAVCYFAAAGVLALRHIYIHSRLKYRLRQMQQLEGDEYLSCLQCRGHRPCLRVYLADEMCSPFAGGILRPYIAVPKQLKNMLSEEEFSAVLYHEAAHIRQGHVLLLHIYALLKILWWIHPLVYILDGKLRENIEYSSDEAGVMSGPLDVYEYAGVMLKTAKMEQRHFATESITAFSEGCYKTLKKRIERLGMLQKILPEDEYAYSKYKKKLRLWMAAAAGAVAAGAALIAATSLPRYTVMEEISVYDEKMNPVTFDLEAEGFFAEAEEDMFSISSAEMEKLVSKYNLKGNYVVFGYDTIMKVPGTGGLGQAAVVSMKDVSDVFLAGRMEWTDRLEAFILKYLI